MRLAAARGCATMVAGIDAQNAASRRLHEALGFACAGTIRHAGYTFGTWLDLVFSQDLFPGPENPVEG
jgi:phosphinothricin acetyltransferase